MLLHLVKKDFLIVKKYVLIMLAAAIAIPPVMLWRAPEYGGVMGFILSVYFCRIHAAAICFLEGVSMPQGSGFTVRCPISKDASGLIQVHFLYAHLCALLSDFWN